MKQILGAAAIFLIIIYGFVYCIFFDNPTPKITPKDFPVPDSIILDSSTAIRWVEYWKPTNTLNKK